MWFKSLLHAGLFVLETGGYAPVFTLMVPTLSSDQVKNTL